MTEEEWLGCMFPRRMLEFLRDRVTDRKLRLFTVGCCRHLEVEIPDQRSWDAVHVAEWYADGNGTEQDLEAARRDAEASGMHGCPAAIHATTSHAWEGAFQVTDVMYGLGWDWYDEGNESDHQAKLLHDIFGNPFRPVAFASEWRTLTVLGLAQTIYEDRVFERMPILGDALEDAGCTNAEILRHCREPGEHVRGCWLLDLILGKE
jgi:hypothetical protein